MALPLCGSLFADCVCVCETAKKGSKDLTALRMATNCEASTTCTALSYLNGRNMHNICRFPSAPPSRSRSLSLSVCHPLEAASGVCAHQTETENGKRKNKNNNTKTKKTSAIYGHRVCPLKPAIASNWTIKRCALFTPLPPHALLPLSLFFVLSSSFSCFI